MTFAWGSRATRSCVQMWCRGSSGQGLGALLGCQLSIATSGNNSAGSSGEACAAAAETAVDVCLRLERNLQLWADVVPRFQRAGALGQLLGCLLPRIMSGQLQSLAPEVMQVPSQAPHIWRTFLTLSSPAVNKAVLASLAPVHVHVCASPFLLSQAIPAFSGCQVMDAVPGDKLVHVPV